MGVCYELLDLKNKRRFELDKGDWNMCGLDVGAALTIDLVRECVASGMRHPEENGSEWRAEFVRRLWAFCEVAGWQIQIYNDCGDYDEEEMGEWPCVDGRTCNDIDPDPCAEQTAAAMEKARGMR